MMKFNCNVFKSNCNSLSKQFNQVHSTCVVYHDICQQSVCKPINKTNLDACNSNSDDQHEFKCVQQTCSNELDNELDQTTCSTNNTQTKNNCKTFSTNTDDHHHHHNHEHGLIYSKRVRSILLLNALLSKPNLKTKSSSSEPICSVVSSQSPSFLSSKWHAYTEQIRNYAKKAGSGSKKKLGKKLDDFDEEDLVQCIELDKFKSDLDDVVENLKNEFVTNINIRIGTNIELLEVEVENNEVYPLKDIARLTKKNNLVTIDCSELPEYTVHVMNAIRKSSMNVNPQQDGTKIFFQQVKSTKEHREQLAKNCKTILQKAKDDLKSIQSNYVKRANLKKGDKISVDSIANCCEYIRYAIQDAMNTCTDLHDQKVKQLLE